MDLAMVILAAGQGTRMKSSLPKVLFHVAGRPMVRYALDAAAALKCDETVIVVGHGADQVRAALDANIGYAQQLEQRGTGHAVMQAGPLLQGKTRNVLVTYADMPLLQVGTLKRLIELHSQTQPTITMLTVRAEESMGFGRIVRDAGGRVQGIVEESDATPEQLAIRELNCGVYLFDDRWLWPRLNQLIPSGKKGEYYLTDLVGIAAKEGCRIESIVLEDVREVLGINTRAHLAQAEQVMRARINEQLMNDGITISDPATTYVDFGVEVRGGTTIEPNTHLKGHTRIGADCIVGPNSIVRDSEIGDKCQIVASVVEEAIVESGVHVGPYAHLRPGAQIAKDVYIGNFAEIKNSRVGEGAHVGHFSYLGDAEIGARVNIGAGTITCNFDGEKKNRTVVGEDTFIGSDTMLVAPVQVGARSKTGAGSVVTKNVPADSLAAGVPARVIRKLR